MTAVLIAHKEHDRGNARGRKDRGIMPGAARHVNVGNVQLDCSGGKTREKIAVHLCRFAAGERAEVEPNAIFLADFGRELVNQRLHGRQRGFGMAAHIDANTNVTRDLAERVLRRIGK